MWGLFTRQWDPATINAYLRDLRIHAAAKRLRESKDRIADIASSVGYENASKFAGVFRERMGKSPSEYGNRAPGVWPDE